MKSLAHELNMSTWNIMEMELLSKMNERFTKVIIDLGL